MNMDMKSTDPYTESWTIKKKKALKQGGRI